MVAKKLTFYEVWREKLCFNKKKKEVTKIKVAAIILNATLKSDCNSKLRKISLQPDHKSCDATRKMWSSDYDKKVAMKIRQFVSVEEKWTKYYTHTHTYNVISLILRFSCTLI